MPDFDVSYHPSKDTPQMTVQIYKDRTKGEFVGDPVTLDLRIVKDWWAKKQLAPTTIQKIIRTGKESVANATKDVGSRSIGDYLKDPNTLPKLPWE